jgi:hypothetical protein
MDTTRLAKLAEIMKLSPTQAVALPIVVEKAARKAGKSESRIMWLIESGQANALRNYLAEVCRELG